MECRRDNNLSNLLGTGVIIFCELTGYTDGDESAFNKYYLSCKAKRILL